jgi:acid phosphatase
MVDLGSKLREELSLDDPPEDDHHVDEKGNRHIHHGRLFHPKHLPLHPKHVTVKSTDFPRTIQSVQGVLVGLFPDAPDETLRIDVRHTSNMIPDPQPRRSKEQEELERQLSSQAHFRQREDELKELAMRATLALKPMLGDGADEVSYGVGEEHSSESADSDSKPLAWTQLAEISKCLQVRNLLPETITEEDQESISNHAAWKWMETLRHPRLAYLAMNPMVSSIMDSMRRRLDGDLSEALHIHSAHDSTLIGLLCAFRLEPPRKWPEYGSYLKIELLEVGSFDSHDQLHDELEEHHYFVRFSLNGEVLHMQWDQEHEEEPLEIIPLELLMEKVSTVGAQ